MLQPSLFLRQGSGGATLDMGTHLGQLPAHRGWRLRRHFCAPARVPCRVDAQMSLPRAPAQRPYTAVMVVPTGIGASIGGYAGDALPAARTLASLVDCLVSHPNVLNGAMLYWPMPNTLYVEGYGLDKFAAGEWGLLPVHQNRVGLVLDAAIEEELLLRHLQVADAVRATLGLPVFEYAVTDAPLQVEKWIDPGTGASTGRIERADSLFRAVEALVERGVEAVAVVARFPDDSLEELEDYREGQGVDCLAGVEAVISHMVVEKFRLPCAHAPALAPIPISADISPRSAAEELGHTFLPCVLAGLSRAPQFVVRGAEGEGLGAGAVGGAGALWAPSVDAIIFPADAVGPAVQSLGRRIRGQRKALLIAVEENETVLEETPEKHGLEAIRVANYWEAAGVIAAHRAGVAPETLRRTTPRMRRIDLEQPRRSVRHPVTVGGTRPSM